MTPRNLLAGLLALLAAALCVTLGLWQLDRHAERRAYNDRIAERSAAPPAPLPAVLTDTASRYRRTLATGTFDYAHELVLANRTRGGSPGVHVLTPLLLHDRDTEGVVLVNRGWLYSPDAAHVDLTAWREPDTVTVHGYVDDLAPTPTPNAHLATPARLRTNVYHRLDSAALAGELPYAIAPVQLIATEITPPSQRTPARLGAPELTRGPHLGYAFQWFAFATIALVGVTILIAQDIRRRR